MTGANFILSQLGQNLFALVDNVVNQRYKLSHPHLSAADEGAGT